MEEMREKEVEYGTYREKMRMRSTDKLDWTIDFVINIFRGNEKNSLGFFHLIWALKIPLLQAKWRHFTKKFPPSFLSFPPKMKYLLMCWHHSRNRVS